MTTVPRGAVALKLIEDRDLDVVGAVLEHFHADDDLVALAWRGSFSRSVEDDAGRATKSDGAVDELVCGDTDGRKSSTSARNVPSPHP